MFFDSKQTSKLNVLTQFNLKNEQDGIKIHHEADPELIAAAQDLYDKGLLTSHDGGYLTDLGRKAAEHVDSLKMILK